MSSQQSRFWSLWWRHGGNTAHRDLAAGDVAKAHTRYMRAVNDWLEAEVAWNRWEIAAVYTAEEIAAGRRVGAARGHRVCGHDPDLDNLEVPAVGRDTLLAAMDETFDGWCAAHDILASFDGDAPAPVRDRHHIDAARRAAGS